jgi:hypothetical protein
MGVEGASKTRLPHRCGAQAGESRRARASRCLAMAARVLASSAGVRPAKSLNEASDMRGPGPGAGAGAAGTTASTLRRPARARAARSAARPSAARGVRTGNSARVWATRTWHRTHATLRASAHYLQQPYFPKHRRPTWTRTLGVTTDDGRIRETMSLLCQRLAIGLVLAGCGCCGGGAAASLASRAALVSRRPFSSKSACKLFSNSAVIHPEATALDACCRSTAACGNHRVKHTCRYMPIVPALYKLRPTAA